jgi:hypothetical protein
MAVSCAPAAFPVTAGPRMVLEMGAGAGEVGDAMRNTRRDTIRGEADRRSVGLLTVKRS